MTFFILSNSSRESNIPIIRQAVTYLTEKGQNVILDDQAASLIEVVPDDVERVKTEKEASKLADFIVAIGGDGTILRAAQLVKKSGRPILGVNSGRLGFLADTRVEELESALDNVINGNWTIDKRFMLQAQAGHLVYHALNEFLFSKSGNISMITLEVYYNDILVNKYLADGLIIATPTGSTAYNLSSGGPIILPETNVMSITAVSPHTLTTRPLVLPADRTVRVKISPRNREFIFSNDGKICDIGTGNSEVTIRKSDYHINLIKLPGKNYFETLRTKLIWGYDLR
jgi:NAD+ kinase